MSTAVGRATVAGALGLVVCAACADKAPEPRWPEPPPPTLAEPLGQDAAQTVGQPATAQDRPAGGMAEDGAAEEGSAAGGATEVTTSVAPNEPADGAVRIDR